MSAKILVSVIIPTFNRAQVIKRAVESVLNQAYKDLEIIIVDDASDDNTADIIGSIQDERIKLVRHQKNKGLAASRNTGIKNSKGGFITFLDDDDEWLPEKIISQINVFQTIDKEIGLIFSNGYSEAENRSIIGKKINSGIIYNPHIHNFFPLWVLITPPSSWMLPIRVINEIGYFDETMYNNWDDGDYFVRLAARYPVYFLNENLVIWHSLKIHVNMVSPNLINGKEIFLKKNMEFLKKDRKYLFRFYRTLGKDALGIDKKKARKYLIEAFKMNPLDSSTVSKLIKTFY